MKKYTILKNWHYCLTFFERLVSWFYDQSEFNIEFKLSKQCWYPKTNSNNHYNKIIGLCFGIFGMHKNSVRLYWIPNFEKPNKLFLYGYSYDSFYKDHESKYFCEIDVDTKYVCTLTLTDDSYEFNIHTLGNFEMENNIEDSKFQKKTFPYFGGKDRAPHKMVVWSDLKNK